MEREKEFELRRQPWRDRRHLLVEYEGHHTPGFIERRQVRG
jgi:hypothetical protein